MHVVLWWECCHVKEKEKCILFLELMFFMCSCNKQMHLISLTPVSLCIPSQQDYYHVYSVSSFRSQLCDFVVPLHWCELVKSKVCMQLHGVHLVITYPHSYHWNLESIQQRIPSCTALLWNSMFSQGVLLYFLSPLPPPPCTDANYNGTTCSQKLLLEAYVFFLKSTVCAVPQARLKYNKSGARRREIS